MSSDVLAYKVVAIGESGVGKTSIINRYSEGTFSANAMPTIGAGYIKCVVPIDDCEVTLNVWDTAGQERFQSLIPLYTRSSQACIIVFDMSSENALASLEKTYEAVSDLIEFGVYISISGNKCDMLTNDFDGAIFEKWAKDKNLSFFRTSAKTGQGIDSLFADVAIGCQNADLSNEASKRGIAMNDTKSGKCCK
ncbi:Vacuolar protein sorting-associated protein 21 [Tritrichomonas foetus]|uniref:Vacuolar protein sorting-associated protein 21 n=1 Tax=Tritrichomonas foetus TaxID=1144522 RepID=A0A1J4JCW3_9EUKA|nr:Vacuolar protein sorting-associated protein 21 [Tritrichomonas foetus]|eukprot:OHS97022.1 Vacuolar protein sorting-associated protein 21 [Tritrichomonas foetus]